MSAFNRLPAPLGLLIDRNRPLAFTFDGAAYQGYAGDSIASALAARGRWLLSRSFTYHRPRGPLTRAGQHVGFVGQLHQGVGVLAGHGQRAARTVVLERARQQPAPWPPAAGCGRSAGRGALADG